MIRRNSRNWTARASSRSTEDTYPGRGFRRVLQVGQINLFEADMITAYAILFRVARIRAKLTMTR
jgi:hypothetical protein